MQSFYFSGNITPESNIILSEEESRHAVKVLRLREGDQIIVLNGQGVKAVAEISRADSRACQCMILSAESQPTPSPRLHIALALLKKRDRMEWFLEKAVEMGAGAITIFTSSRTEKSGMDKERLQRIAISAMKQSNNWHLPVLQGPIPLTKLIENVQEENRMIAYCPTDQTQLLKYSARQGADTIILIGPEGDFTEAEVELALRQGFTPVSLGPLRLRAETAALSALMTMQVVNQ